MKPGDRVLNIKTGWVGIIAEKVKYGYLVNYSDEKGVMFRKSYPDNLVLLEPDNKETKT